MGSWGHHAFENDTALDWLTTFEANRSAAFISSTILRTPREESQSWIHRLLGLRSNSIEPSDEEVLAAIETLCVLRGAPSHIIPDELETSNELDTSEITIEVCLRALDYLEQESLLRSAWEEAGARQLGLWLGEVEDLRTRISNT